MLNTKRQQFSRVKGRVIARNNAGAMLVFDAACNNQCSQHCAKKNQKKIHLPDDRQIFQKNNQIELSMNLGGQIYLLVNSLVLPLLGFVCGVGIADKLGMGDWGNVSFSLLGFMFGIILCRPFPIVKLSINEV